MKRSSCSPSMPILFLSALALCNTIILLATIYNVYAPEKEVAHTWIDRDHPLQMPTGPIDTVEMTFQESRRYGFTDNDTTDNWETLFTNQFGIGFAHLGPFHHRFISAAYHSLHCVYSMARDFDKPNHVARPSHHFIHCLNYMRQIFLCKADSTLEPGDFMMRNSTVDRMGATRQCRDWVRVDGWLNENLREWADYNEVSLDELE